MNTAEGFERKSYLFNYTTELIKHKIHFHSSSFRYADAASGIERVFR